MMRFGPSGNSESFYAAGYKHSHEAPQWLRELGLSAYEYSFGRGVNLTEQSAEKIGVEARKNNIQVSVHAPYYINLANPDEEKARKSMDYILSSARMLRCLGGDRIVLHIGAQMKLERSEALRLCRERLHKALGLLEDEGLSSVRLCPETMGKRAQIGDLEETLQTCLMDERLIPCIDFAHLHALWGGALNSEEDFAKVLDPLERALGIERARELHIHFSAIEYTQAGEKQHRTFAEKDFGPRFEHLAPLLKARNYHATVICECRGTMAEDALLMKNIYEKTKEE